MWPRLRDPNPAGDVRQRDRAPASGGTVIQAHQLLAPLQRLSGQAYLLLVFTTLLWSGNSVAGRLAIGEVSPMVIVSFRWIIVVAVLAATSHRTILAEWRVLLPVWPRAFLLGSVGFTVYNAIYYVAAYHTTAVNIGLIQGIVPVLAMAGAFFAYGTPIRPLQIVGLLVALIGVILVASRGELATLLGLDFNIGDVFMMGASAIYAAYTVALRERPPVSGTTFFAALAIAAMLTSLPFLGYEVASGIVMWPTRSGWAILAYIAIAPSLIAQVLYIRCIGLIGPGRAGLFVNLVPVFSALLGVAILGETFAVYHAVALVLVLGGIAIAERGRA